jgi:hypothetical protein
MTWLLVFPLILLAPKREFHQGVDYVIEARLDDSTSVLTARSRIRYTNRSPQRLKLLPINLYLNAFRPNSAWATRELEFNQRRFQDLAPDDYGYERVQFVRVNGTLVTPTYPLAPDSTVMVVPANIASGATATITMEWTARLSTVPRRQGRKDRHYDFAQWYPRIAVYDTSGWHMGALLPQGEFYGDFATYDVTLDLAGDQVIGATGLPISGDPGWEHVNRLRKPPFMPRAYRPRASTPLGLLTGVQPGRKRVRWRAEQVIDFGWAADPNYVYEGDRLGDVALHALFLPTDTLWPANAISRMKRSLMFYDTMLGPYAYPQLTATRRLDGGGTEFPMHIMLSASMPVVHEAGHEWMYAVLANNETRDGWLDEGLVSFLGNLYSEADGAPPDYLPALTRIAASDSSGASQPIATPGPNFRTLRLYQEMTYEKPRLVFRMLRWYLGSDVMKRGLQLYYRRHKMTHVDERDLRTALEQAAKQDLRWFFKQWVHTTGTLDYAIESAESKQSGDLWSTTVSVKRSGQNWMPVDLRVGNEIVRLSSRQQQFTASITTTEKPSEAVLDPQNILIDTNRVNNRKELN